MQDKRAFIDATIRHARTTGQIFALSDGQAHDVFPVAIDPEQGDAIARHCRSEGARRILEVGLGYGFSALNALRGALESGPDGLCYVTIDPHQERRFANVGRDLLRRVLPQEQLRIISEPSEMALPRLLGEEAAFDVALVDGNHRFEHVFLDLFYLERLVRPRGVVFIDDYQLPAIRKALAFFAGNLGWTIEHVSPDDPLNQWAVVRRPADPVTRDYRTFADF